MRIDFNEIASMTFPGMDNGTGMMSARMYNDDSYRIIPTAIHPGGSIGNHNKYEGRKIDYRSTQRLAFTKMKLSDSFKSLSLFYFARKRHVRRGIMRP